MEDIRELAESCAAQNDDIPLRDLARFAIAVLAALDECRTWPGLGFKEPNVAAGRFEDAIATARAARGAR